MRRASGMRAANSLLFAGGTALSWPPQTTRVGASMQPRTGMLDQVEMARICQSKPNGSGRGHRVPRFGVSRIWVTSLARPGTAPTPQAVASSTSRFTRVGWPTANCWATAPPWEYPTTSAFWMPTASRTRAATSDNIGIEYGTTGVSLAPTPGASNAMTVLSRSAPAKDAQLSIGRDMPLSNNTAAPDPVVRAAIRRPPVESTNVSESTVSDEWVMRWPGRKCLGLSR
jgi:hypothetical protein